MADAIQLLKLYDRAKVHRDGMVNSWDHAARLTMPHRDAIQEQRAATDVTPNTHRPTQLFDTTAIDANKTYAAGCMSWMTPSETTWSSYDAPPYLSDNDAVKSWYSKCTDETRRILAGSNFYSAIHECYLDDGAFGTCGLLVEEDEKEGLRFEVLQIGSYAILEDHRRRVNMLFRELNFTPRQAIEKFGQDAVSEATRKAADEGSEAKNCYVHVLMPRDDANRIAGKIDSQNLPWASVYIDTKSKEVIRESGFWENPAAVHRHLLWGTGPYGFAPAMQSLADALQLQKMQESMDALVEKQVTPPVLVPAGFKGKVDLRAKGYTYFKSGEEKPQFWQNPGNYMIGEDRIEFRRTQINRAFHVDLFQALAAVPVGKEMTAAEIHMRQRDRLTLFSPTFARKNTELITPSMRHTFALLLRAGAFPEPPPGLVQQSPEGLPFIPDPEITYTSRLALQIRAIHNESFLRTVEMISPLAAMDPGIMDHLDMDSSTRGIARNEGMPEDWLRSERDVAEMREARQREQQRLEEEASAMNEADSIAKLASANVITTAA